MALFLNPVQLAGRTCALDDYRENNEGECFRVSYSRLSDNLRLGHVGGLLVAGECFICSDGAILLRLCFLCHIWDRKRPGQRVYIAGAFSTSFVPL